MNIPVGLGVSSAFYITYNAGTKPLDEIELDFYYTHEFSPNIGGTIMYSHYFFSENSNSSKSYLSQSLSAEFNFEYPYFTITPNFSFDFGNGFSQFTMFLYASSPIPVSKNFLGGKLGTEPTITGTYGEQLSVYSTKVKNKRGKTVNIPKAKSIFCVLDYELTLPLIYEYKSVTVKPYATLIIPVNVMYDELGSSNPFFTFTIEVNIPFSLK